jgi:hypothetical protein
MVRFSSLLLVGSLLSLPGDETCDGQVDLSDPIHLLLYLFKEGAPPCSSCEDRADRMQADGEALVAIVARLEIENLELKAALDYWEENYRSDCDGACIGDLMHNLATYRCWFARCQDRLDPFVNECGGLE